MDNIKNFFNYISDFEYGWSDKDGNINHKITKNYVNDFSFRSKENVIKSHVGVCWEICEIERDFFIKNKLPFKIIMVHHNDEAHHCHTFSIFEYDNKFYWFEGVLKGMKDIFEFDTLEELFEYIIDNFHYVKLDKNFDRNKIQFFEYDEPVTGCSCLDFYEHCFNGKLLYDNKKYLL